MDERQGSQHDKGKLRASDADRQEVIERLRTALEEGRLKMDEYVQRMEQASEAVTYGDLASLHADLPGAGTVARPDLAALAPDRPRPVAARGGFAGLPTPLRVLWTIWASVVFVNVVIWGLTSATTAQLIYPWPVWVAGPWGAVLLAVSVSVTQGRRGGQPK
jgi:Domain of unknown function (DUF1707)